MAGVVLWFVLVRRPATTYTYSFLPRYASPFGRPEFRFLDNLVIFREKYGLGSESGYMR